MKLHTLLSFGALSAVGFLAPVAFAQTPANSAGSTASATATPSAPLAGGSAIPAAKKAAAGSASTQGQNAPVAEHAKPHHKTYAKAASHKKRQGSHMVSYRHETPYRMALRHCVEGPAAQKDRCIDDTISRFGHA